jgi:cation diffusion facilitator CzcD-associated flavoprotein CzcO
VATETTSTNAEPTRDDLRFIIMGAGMSGILSAIKLQEAGLNDYVIYEKADRLGGTWRENEYPGIACDVPSHMYSYSFAPNPEWTHRHSPGPEIQAYFEDVARRYEVDGRIQYGKEVTRCEFTDGRWKIELSDGSADEGDIVIAATGVLHHPAYPEIEGLDSFGGETFHTARWNHDVSLEGKRVGVIGTGSTAVQITTAVVDQVAKYTLFQRTPQWVLPIQNPAYSDEERAEFREHPEAMQKIRGEVTRQFIDGFANILHEVDNPALLAMHAVCEANLNDSVKDPVLKEKLRPNYRAACKRLIMSENFYEAIQHPNAELVTEGIERIEESGVRTSDGRLHELDVLVLATGFRVDRFMRPMEVVGCDGQTLEEVWADGPLSYKAISIPGFPNLFMLNGPYGPVGNFSLIDVAEMQFSYIMQLIDQVRSGSCKALSASRAATEQFDAERIEAAKHTIWASGCDSWYLDADGIPAAWPFTFDRFTEEMEKPLLDHYDTR